MPARTLSSWTAALVFVVQAFACGGGSGPDGGAGGGAFAGGAAAGGTSGGGDSSAGGSATGGGTAGGASSFDGGPGTPGYCASTHTGTPVIVMGSSNTTGTHFYKVYPDGEYDEEWFHVVGPGGAEISAYDFVRRGNGFVLLTGSKYFSVTPPSGSSLEAPLGMEFTFPGGGPPTTEYLTNNGGGPVIARLASALYEVNFELGTWKSLGGVKSPAAQCGLKRDFTSGGSGGNIVRFLAFCTPERNAIVETEYNTLLDGGLTSTSVILQGSPIADTLIGFPATNVALTSSRLYVNGAMKRPLRQCLNDGLLSIPVPFVLVTE